MKFRLAKSIEKAFREMQTNCIWDVILEIKPTLNKKKKSRSHISFILFLVIKLSITSTLTRMNVVYSGMGPYVP